MKNQNIVGRIFPFIPLVLGFLLVFFQKTLGKPDPHLPVALMFVVIIACMTSWLFSTIGLYLFREDLFYYYRTLFKILSVVYILPAVILAIFIPWSLLFSLTIFLAGVIMLIRGPNFS